jgi:hypothetical protein
LYYTDLDHLADYLDYGTLIAEVEPKGQIYNEKNKWKTDKLFVHKLTPFKEWLPTQSEKIQLEVVTRYCDVIKLLENPSEEIKLAAVTRRGVSIQFIKNPSREIQLAAVKQNGESIQFIEDPSEESILACGLVIKIAVLVSSPT